MTVIRLTRLFSLLEKKKQPSNAGNRQVGLICQAVFATHRLDTALVVSGMDRAVIQKGAPEASVMLTALWFSDHRMTFPPLPTYFLSSIKSLYFLPSSTHI